MPEKKTCFVVMGFGPKVDFETGRKLNLDASYHNVIKPAIEDAGLECVRADEIAHSGVIDVPMYEKILLADLVVADVSTANCNAFYELGVRHALRPYTTIIISEDQFKFPFDINRNKILTYKHLGEDIGFGEAKRFAKQLKEAVQSILENDPPAVDSPVYTFMHGLRRLKLPQDLSADTASGPVAAPAQFEVPAPSADVSAKAVEAALDQTHNALMKQVDEAQTAGEFDRAKALLGAVRALRPDDAYITQRLALVTYKNNKQPVVERFQEARDLLLTLNPATSNDTETLGLWGAVHKNLWEATAERKHLDEAIRGYKRGFYLRNDYYNGINFAYMLNVRSANAQDRAEAIADYVQARRVREEVVEICDAWLDTSSPQLRAFVTSTEVPADERYRNNRYWVMVTKAEAFLGSGRTAEAETAYNEAFAAAPADWMVQTAKTQRTKLEELLAQSPLKYLKKDGD
jgi:tetratricopeptide (TPR) repeat protein